MNSGADRHRLALGHKVHHRPARAGWLEMRLVAGGKLGLVGHDAAVGAFKGEHQVTPT